MDVKTLATEVGTEPRIFRRFLRATRPAVGSGSRYTFNPDELTALKTDFQGWVQGRKLSPVVKATSCPSDELARDQEVWNEEEAARRDRGALSVAQQLHIMRTNARARKDAQRAAQARVQRLEERLMAAGLHISQMRAS